MSPDLAALGYHRADPDGPWLPAQSAAFGYNDGDAAETAVAQAVAAATDRSSTSAELAARIVDWPTRYHLSPLRGNVVRPLLGTLRGPVLEIGAGMGAITRVLGEAGLEVTAVEGSRRRAEVCAARCRDLGNVTVVADTIQGFGAPARFGTVVMIGVLEYARTFGFPADGRDPVDVMLAHVASLLEPDGQLVLAIENQLGAKYLAGFPEDHLGARMLGVQDGYGARTAVTFGRAELGRRLAAAGLAEQQWHFPFPDYKLPTTVLTEHALARDDFDPLPLLLATAHRDPQEPAAMTLDLARLYPALARNGLVADLSNSFLVRASRAPLNASTELAWFLPGDRGGVPRPRVTFEPGPRGPVVRRSGAGPDATEPYLPGGLWSHELLAITGRPGWGVPEAVEWFRFWTVCIEGAAGRRLTAGATLPPHLLDAIPRNLVVHHGVGSFIDLEWRSPGALDAHWLTFRALLHTFLEVGRVARPAPGTPGTLGGLVTEVAAAVGMALYPDRLADAWAQEQDFQLAVTGQATGGGHEATLAQPLPLLTDLDQAFTAGDELARVRASVAQALTRFAVPVG